MLNYVNFLNLEAEIVLAYIKLNVWICYTLITKGQHSLFMCTEDNYVRMRNRSRHMGNISSGFSMNSEANTLELIKNVNGGF